MTGRRYALAQVVDHLHIQRSTITDGGATQAMIQALRVRFGVSESAAKGRVRRGARLGLTERQADELATALGVHPSEVWPDFGAEAEEVSA